MKPKLSLRMRTYYYTIICIVVICSAALVAAALFILDRLDASLALSITTLAAIFVVAAVVGALMSYFIGQRVLAPMVKLSQASKEVAKGNFDLTVSDTSKLEEVQTTFRNFNSMLRQLKSTATLSNDFVANVSHEFKTPLGAIEGYAMLLQDPTLSEEEKNEYLEKILYNTQRMTTLVGNVLTLTKLENKALADSFTEFSLDEQIRQTVVFLEREWDAKELKMDAQLDAVRFCGSESLLPHVWSNLLSNAICASPVGGLIRLRLLEQTECVVFTVTDEGCGMSEEVQSRIFEKFYQADPSHNSSGNGLGLPLVKHIVQLCDGVIEVESEEGKGSTFRVILPK